VSAGPGNPLLAVEQEEQAELLLEQSVVVGEVVPEEGNDSV
jgi:hypothetical protein